MLPIILHRQKKEQKESRARLKDITRINNLYNQKELNKSFPPPHTYYMYVAAEN